MSFDPSNPIGIHADVSDELYGEAAGVRRSELKQLIDGHPLDLLHYQQKGIPDSPALRMGSAVDLMVLTPDLVEGRIAVSDTQSRRGKGWDEFLKSNPDKLCLSIPEWEQACELTRTVQQAPNAKKFLAGTHRQLSAFWEHETDSGQSVICKARPDAVFDDEGRTLDLKTCQNLDDRTLNYAIHDYAYDLQGAMCAEGFLANGFEWKEHVLIFVRKTLPIDVRVVVWTLDSPWITRGLALFGATTSRYADMVQHGHRHGWNTDVTALPMEGWIDKKTTDLISALQSQ